MWQHFKKEHAGLFQPCEIYCQGTLLQQQNDLLNEIIFSVSCEAALPVSQEEKYKDLEADLLYVRHSRCFLLYTL